MDRLVEIEEAEALLAGACAAINAAVLAKGSLGDGAEKFRRELARALVAVCEAREALYQVRPDLRPSSMPHPDDLPSR